MSEHDHAWGWVPSAGRGQLPFALIHGESLVAAATWALVAAEIEPLDLRSDLTQIGADLVVLHDPLCPMVPADFLTSVVQTARERGTPVVAVRPVTDTIKRYDDDLIGHTVDRTRLRAVTSPIVLRADQLAGLGLELDSVDFVELVGLLDDVEFVDAPTEGARVHSEVEIAMLEAIGSAIEE